MLSQDLVQGSVSGSQTSLPPRITWRNWAVSFRRTWRGFRRCRRAELGLSGSLGINFEGNEVQQDEEGTKHVAEIMQDDPASTRFF